MGLAERRKAKNLEEVVLPAAIAELKQIAGEGGELEFYIDWNNYLKDMKTLENLEAVGLPKIVEIFKRVCVDDVGKQCIQKSLKRIDLMQFEDAVDHQITFFSGALCIAGNWADATADGWPPTDEIQEVLEKGL